MFERRRRWLSLTSRSESPIHRPSWSEGEKITVATVAGNLPVGEQEHWRELE